MESGEYKFDASKIEEAHNACLRKFVSSLQNSAAPIVVDNTNLTVEELAPYYCLARAFGYEVEIVRCWTSVNEAVQQNVHGVTKQTLEFMQRKWYHTFFDAGLPKFWQYKRIYI